MSEHRPPPPPIKPAHPTYEPGSHLNSCGDSEPSVRLPLAIELGLILAVVACVLLVVYAIVSAR